jgi:hypothetical protein
MKETIKALVNSNDEFLEFLAENISELGCPKYGIFSETTLNCASVDCQECWKSAMEQKLKG